MSLRCFGENLKREMSATEYVPHTLASELDLGVRAVWNYQKGVQAPDLDKIIHISKTLKVSPNQLLLGCYEDHYSEQIRDLQDKLERTEHRKMFVILIEYFNVCHQTLAGKSLGPRVRTARLERGLSVEELAGMVGVSKTSVNSYETDNQSPRFIKFIRLCEALEVSAEFLLFGDLNKEQEENPDIMYNNLMNLSPGQVELLLKLLKE